MIRIPAKETNNEAKPFGQAIETSPTEDVPRHVSVIEIWFGQGVQYSACIETCRI